MRTKLQGINEKMTTLQGNWEVVTIKLQELDLEVVNVRAQLQMTKQEWETKLNDDRTLLLRQSGQVQKVESTLGKIQTTQSTVAGVMEKIQNYVIQDANQDETTSVDKTPTIMIRAYAAPKSL